MKEKLEELRAKLEDCSNIITDLVTVGVNMTLSVETEKKVATFTCSNPTRILITSATIQTEL